ncbi:MAG: hypothetical protein AAF629_05810 [Chloroflexota bacterium]
MQMDVYTFLIIIAFFVTVIALSSGNNRIKAQVIAVLSKLLGAKTDDYDDRS